MAAKKKTKRVVKEKGENKKSKSVEIAPDKSSSQELERVKKNNKLLVIILSLLGLVLIAFFTGYFLIASKNSFNYKGVEFNVIQEGNLVFYNTQVPIYDNKGKQISAYNFYLRTDPRKLGKMDFNETIIPMKLMAINYSDDMSCNGYGTIALTNIINLYELIGAKVIIDKEANCDTEGRYIFLNFKNAEETSLEKVGKNCYNLNAKDCDVFPSTERFMLDTFVKIKQEDIRAISSGA